ncbi:MAG: hypothetical protein F4Y45_09920 [Acidobacteria bacterium]|nr:hypothetical protein [Acidobacteriota bacterium]MXZ73026.1 hypothetical protein [Acidobacteriota bacterium]MYD71647.1 hypothetical protein [Acidobacteriota bacterium]MYJ04431.1 hypothetical protein [Acidobacteriota bacterium]
MPGPPKLAQPSAPVTPAVDPARPGRQVTPIRSVARSAPSDDAVICERCGAEMFRMHAVWRCPNCRYKTDCCGW